MKKMYPLERNLNLFLLFYFERDYMYNWQTQPDKPRQRNATSEKRQRVPGFHRTRTFQRGWFVASQMTGKEKLVSET